MIPILFLDLIIPSVLRRPLQFALALCAIALTIPTYRFIDAQRGAATAAIHAEGEANRKLAEKWANEHLLPLAKDVADNANARTSDLLAIGKQLGNRAITVLDHTGNYANARVADLAERGERGLTATLAEAHGAIGEIHELRGQLEPVLAGTTKLLGTYEALPGQIAAEVRPSWNALEPEITCRKDGNSYSGCWHSDITAVLGEAKRAGGTFTQQFPLFAKSLSGMASDGHAWTSKYVLPHPMTRWQKVETGLKTGGVIGVGLARAGVF